MASPGGLCACVPAAHRHGTQTKRLPVCRTGPQRQGEGLGFGVWCVGCGVWGLGVWGVVGLGFGEFGVLRVRSLGFGVWGLEFGGWASGFGFWVLGFGVLGEAGPVQAML